MKTIQYLRDYLSGLPEGEISPGQFMSVDTDNAISLLSIWNGGHTELIGFETAKAIITGEY